MPLTDLGSYVLVMDEFATHWGSANTELGGTPATDLKLEGGYTLANFITDRDAIEAALIAQENLENIREVAAAQRDTLKAAARQTLGQFRALLRARLPKSKYAKAVQPMPDFSASPSRFLGPLDDMHGIWTMINADTAIAGFTPPLTLGAYALANFTTDLAALRTAYTDVAAAETAQNVGREDRNALLPPARERMIQYRAGVEAIFGVNHPLTNSLPDLDPAPGSTPNPVTLSGVWNAATGQAELTWTASTNPNLEEYEVRMSPGPTYDAATSSVIGNVPPGTTTFNTTEGLAFSGDVASFKVFVRLTTGNQSGSNTVTITRP